MRYVVIILIFLSCSSNPHFNDGYEFNSDMLIGHKWFYKKLNNDSLNVCFSKDSIYIQNLYSNPYKGSDISGNWLENSRFESFAYRIEHSAINGHMNVFLIFDEYTVYRIKHHEGMAIHDDTNGSWTEHFYTIELQQLDGDLSMGLKNGSYFRSDTEKKSN